MRWQRGFAHGVVVALALCAAFLQARGLTQLVYAGLLASFPAPPPDPPPEAQTRPAPAAPAPAAPAPRALAPRLATPPAAPTNSASAVARASPEASSLSPRRLISGLRVVPDTVDGRVIGVRLVGVRQGSLLSLLGLHDGDRLQAINGYELTSPGNALRAYAALRHETDFDLELSRQGQTIRLTYRVR